MKSLDKELFDEYKKKGRGSWGKDLKIWKTMYNAFLNQAKEQEITPTTELLLDIFLSIPKARKEGNSIIMHPFNYEPVLILTMAFFLCRCDRLDAPTCRNLFSYNGPSLL